MHSPLPKKIATQVVDALNRRKEMLVLAESCTGGQLASVFSILPGVSSVFAGSCVVYHNEWKQNFLGIENDLIKTEGAVSRSVAIRMAQGVRSRGVVTGKPMWAVAVTGIAGPSGGSLDKPVGTVWIAIAGPNFEEARVQLFQGDREQVQAQTVVSALSWLHELLTK